MSLGLELELTAPESTAPPDYMAELATLIESYSVRVEQDRMVDEAFAIKYLKESSLFPVSGPGRWFDPPPLHHHLTAEAGQSLRVLMQLPREFAKSSKFTIVRSLRLICENRNVRIVVISNNQRAASRFVGAVRRQLETNERIKQDYGTFRPDGKDGKWSDDQFTVVRSSAAPQPTMQAVGRGGQIVSGRYEYVVLDDVEDYESTRTDAARLKTAEWLKQDVIPIVLAGGSLYIIQTPQHEGDVVGQMRQQGGVWKFINIPAEEPTADIDPVSGVRRRSNWPEKWPIYWTDCAVKKAEQRGLSDDRLAAVASNACRECPVYNPSKGDTDGVGCLSGKRLAEVGSVFYRLQYLVDIRAFGGDVFKPVWWRYYQRSHVHFDHALQAWIYTDPETSKSYPMDVVAGCDPALAEEDEAAGDATHSKFAIVVLGYVAELHRRLLLETVNVRADFPTQKRIIRESWKAWHWRVLGIEEVAYQKTLRQGLRENQEDRQMPIRGMKADNDKFRRIVTLTPEIEAGNFYLLAPFQWTTANGQVMQHPGSTEFKGQAESFPKGTLRDLLDAAYYAGVLVGRPKMFQELAAKMSVHPREAEDQAEQKAKREAQRWTDADLMRYGVTLRR